MAFQHWKGFYEAFQDEEEYIPPMSSVSDIQEAILLAQKRAQRIIEDKYSYIASIGFYWKNGDVEEGNRDDVEEFATMLKNVFPDVKETITHPIDLSIYDEVPHDSVIDTVKKFQRYNLGQIGARRLLIFHYSGHSIRDKNNLYLSQTDIISKDEFESVPMMSYDKIHNALYELTTMDGFDVLVVMDCGHAGLSYKGRPKGRFQYICATPANGMTLSRKAGGTSFTQHLMSAFKRKVFEKAPFRDLDVVTEINDYYTLKQPIASLFSAGNKFNVCFFPTNNLQIDNKKNMTRAIIAFRVKENCDSNMSLEKFLSTCPQPFKIVSYYRHVLIVEGPEIVTNEIKNPKPTKLSVEDYPQDDDEISKISS